MVRHCAMPDRPYYNIGIARYIEEAFRSFPGILPGTNYSCRMRSLCVIHALYLYLETIAYDDFISLFSSFTTRLTGNPITL